MHITLHTVVCFMFILLSNGYAAEKPSSASLPFPGLLVVNLIVKDKEKFDIYAQKVKPILETHKAELYFRGVNPQSLFGVHKHHVFICFKFPGKEEIKKFYASKDYQSLIPLRSEAADVVFTAYDIVQEEEQIDMRSLLAVNVLIKDKTKFETYGKAAGSIVKSNGGQLQLRASNPEVLFGENPYKVLVLFKFPGKETIQTFYNSEEYQKIIPLRTEGADVVFTSYDL